MRVGIGYDLHPLVKDRALILGGVTIPFDLGLDGHSDADVLCHAIADALLGGGALGDIGEHFPDTDPAYRNSSSLLLLGETARIVRTAGYDIVNVDATILAERPKLSAYKKQMTGNIAAALSVSETAVSVKATTNEGMDAVGRGEAIAVYAVAFLTGTKPGNG